MPALIFSEGNILLLDFFCFHIVRPLIDIISNDVCSWKTRKAYQLF